MDPSKPTKRPKKSVKIAVIGAGISGLAAAASLVQEGFDVILLEASDYIGGRVKQAQPFPGFPPVDLGGGFIHGSNTIINQLAKENVWKVKKSHGFAGENPDTVTFFMDGKLYSWQDKTQPDIIVSHRAFQEITASRKTTDKEDVSENYYADDFVNEKLNQYCSTDKSKEIFNVLYPITHAGSVSHYGLAELESKLKIDSYWGKENYRLEGSYSVLISHYLEKCTEVDKRLNWPVKEVKWDATNSPKAGYHDSPGVVITNHIGESVTVEHAIITVPLTILKDGDIIFSPPLPSQKQHAINVIYMGAALKIVCRFKTPFWREKTVILAVRGFLSQIWTYSRDPKENGEECHVVVGFETAVQAAQKVNLSDETVCEMFLQQLDEIFGTSAEPNPASSNFINFVYQHWSKHPYVRGGYSSPTANAYGLRQHLAEPLKGRLFFAGEATNHMVSAKIQGAIETGIRAAREVKDFVDSI